MTSRLQLLLAVCVAIYVTIQFSVWFMRSPSLIEYARDETVDNLRSPASGTVREVRPGYVRIFLSLFDLHVQYVPAKKDRVIGIEETPSRSRITKFESGVQVEQRSGWLARTTHSYLYAGQSVEQGQKLGAILFGSTTVITWPPEKYPHLQVKVGDTVDAVRSVIASG